MDFNKFLKIFIGLWVVFWLLVSYFSLLIFPAIVSAQSTANVKAEKETTGAAANKPSYTYPWTGKTNLTDLISTFYNIALGLVGVAALGAIIYGGILWTVSKSPSGSQEAKDWISGAIWGLLLLLGAYLLFNTIGIIKKGQLVEPSMSEATPSATETENTPIETIQGQGLSEIEARNQLHSETNWIGVKDECTPGKSTDCVKLAGIRQSTLTEINNLRKNLKKEYSRWWSLDDRAAGTVYITGGTEIGVHTPGEYSHANGYKVDLRLNDKLDRYIETHFEKLGTRSDGAVVYKSPSGALYAKENDHWDVLVK